MAGSICEVKEETGLNVKVTKLAGVYSEPDKDEREVVKIATQALWIILQLISVGFEHPGHIKLDFSGMSRDVRY